MSEPLLPPPRRPAPQDLRDRIAADLDRAASRKFRMRYLAAPVAAAALVAVTVLGVTTLSNQRRAEPANPSPAPVSALPTAMPTPSTPKPDPTTTAPVPAAPLSLDVRAMTTTEIAQDTTSCGAAKASTGLVSDPTHQYARVQRLAGIDGPGSEIRALVDQNADETQACQNGSDVESGAGQPDDRDRPSRSVPAVEIANFGSTHGRCPDRDDSLVSTSKLYAVSAPVAVGRIRFNRGQERGPWQVTTPLDGLVYFPVALTDSDAWTAPLTFDIQFLDRNGERLTLQPYGVEGNKTTQTQTTEIESCSSLQDHTEQELTLPKSDAAGKTQCLSLAADDDPESGSFLKAEWRAELVVSTKDEWGAVLSDGKRRFGCSLYPTKEVSRVTDDSTEVTAASFYFALNPIAANDGVSLWAAGRVPKDVTKISYALPGGRDVAARIDQDGFWMVKYHVDGADLALGDVSDWEPVVVTVTRPSGRQTYQIPFSSKSMCNQVSHGC